MLKVKDNTITLTIGDTAYLNVNISADGVIYAPSATDTITLSVKQNKSDREYALQKRVVVGEMITIAPQDTIDLKAGKYFYDVQLDTAAGEVFTIIEPTGFYLEEGITD